MDKSEVKKLVVKSAVRVVELDRLGTDQSYQRNVKRKVGRIVEEFDEDSVGVPLVAEREDGTLWVVDGLQRLTALRKMGFKEYRCKVFNSRGPEHEAQVFKRVNFDRTKLTSTEQFRSLLTGHDTNAWAIKKVVEAKGYRLALAHTPDKSKENETNYLRCFSTLLKVASKRGIEYIGMALEAVSQCWPGDILGINSNMIDGMCGFFYSYRDKGGVDMERLVPRLRTVTPQKILYAASQMSITGDRAHAVAEQIEKVYSKRKPRSRS